MEQFQSLVGLMPWTWIFTICNLLVLTAGVKHFLFKPVQAILAKRQESIQTQYTEAEKAEESAKAMQVEYEARLANAKAEATDIVKTATTRATMRGEELVSAARNEANALKVKADADIASERKRAAGELKNDISSLALGIAGKVVEKEIDPATHRALIDEFIQQVGEVS
ncbi:MAG: F0F1 ATP synthase subunit B [Ruthenibacterium sp.]